MTDITDEFQKLLTIMAQLRDAKTGCPWDLEQTLKTIVPHTLEEAYEVADAIEKSDMAGLVSELGDLLFQVVFYSQIASENGDFSIIHVLKSINNKMIERHPHVFSTAIIKTASAQTLAWENQKATERAKLAQASGRPVSVLDGVITALPALTRAEKLQKRAARIGFDWQKTSDVLDKVAEELNEVQLEIGVNSNQAKIDEELGDLLFSVTNLARHLNVEPEGALRRANAKFERRFRAVEGILQSENKNSDTFDLESMEKAWNSVKQNEKNTEISNSK